MKYVSFILGRTNSKLRYKKYKLYHLSPVEDNELTTMIPRVPDNNMTRSGSEDNITKRISFAPSIGKCLAAIAKENLKGKVFRVYALDYMPKGFYPSTKQVEDAEITKEYWVTEPISENKLIYLGKIKVLQAKPRNLDFEDVINRYPEITNEGAIHLNKIYKNKEKYRTFKTKSNKYGVAYSYDWSWKWI